MIYLRGNGNSANTNDEECAQKLEFERLTNREIFLKRIIPGALANGLAVGLGMGIFAILPGTLVDAGVACILTLVFANLFGEITE